MKIKEFFTYAFNKWLPLSNHDVGSLSYWRERILFSILFSGVLLGSLVIIAIIPLVIIEQRWNLLIFDSLSWIAGLLLLIYPNISFHTRVIISVVIMYTIGLFLTIHIGPLSGGPAWLFSFSVISGVLLGTRASIISVLINAATLSIVGFLFINTSLGQSLPFFNTTQHMYAAGVNFLFLNALCSISVSVLLKGLNRSHEKEKRLSASLQKSEKKYKHIYDNAPAGMYEFDFTTGRFISVNKVMHSYTGYSEKELLSMDPMELFTNESRKLLFKTVKRIISGEIIIDKNEYNIITKKGKKLSIIINSDFIWENEKLKKARVVLHDITELKKEEKEKIKAQKIAGEQKKLGLIGQIAGKMAHDFNNILGIIMGNAELSLLDCKDAAAKKSFKLIFEQTIQGKNLTKNLVAFAKSHEPKQEFFKIDERVDLVIDLLKRDLKKIEVIKEVREKMLDLLADPGMIEHALVNLVQNSIHALSLVENPRIIIRTYNSDDFVCFEIEDNGCGIPEKHIKNIFDPSFTLKGSNDTTGSYATDIKGTGYGMSNVKKYIDQHMGTISVQSEFGLGAKFTICLPVTIKELINKEKTELKKKATYFKKNILLVEDEADISDVQYRVLTQKPCNHKVDIASDGQIAKEMFNKKKYDLISLDYVLSGYMNGMDIYNHIRKTDRTVPVLFISGNIEFLESIRELKQKDAYVDHLSKPCQNKNYLSSINKLLKKTGTEQ